MNKQIIEELIELSLEFEDILNWNGNTNKVMKKVRAIYKKVPREQFEKASEENEELEYALMLV